MTIRKIEKIEKLVDHPLEEFFNIEPTTTEIVKFQRKTELIEYGEFDGKDKELEQDFQEIADAAMTSYDTIQEMVDNADTKLVARLTEVSAQMLNTALAALTKKAHLKENKDKLIARQKIGPVKNTNNFLVMDRNELLRKMMAQDEVDEDVIDVTPVKE